MKLAEEERAKLLKGGALHWIHWLVIATSLLLTFGAYSFSKKQVDDKIQNEFDREVAQVIELISERLQKYEDGLWGGVGAVHANGRRPAPDSWNRFYQSLRLDKKYPGISGIGIIEWLASPVDLQEHLVAERLERPHYAVYPEHDQPEYLPITLIEPIAENGKALGLDIAHENNRYTAAKKARDTGTAQITGPIVLVQDAGKTPGFLFYAPYYEGGAQDSLQDRQEKIRGMVYAPFVVKKLMEGVLSSDRRGVALQIKDAGTTIFDELNPEHEDFDANPLFKRQVSHSLYGRTWNFEIWSDAVFRKRTASGQPIVILIGGIFIDLLLVWLFVTISRSNRRAVEFADLAVAELEQQKQRLEMSNKDLEQFAYIAAHDLQEPIRMVASYAQLLQEELQEEKLEDQTITRYLKHLIEGAFRMQKLVDALLKYSRVDNAQRSFETVEAGVALKEAMTNLSVALRESDAVVITEDLPEVSMDKAQLTQVFQNLLANSIKFQQDKRPEVRVSAKASEGPSWTFSVQDNGIGIAPEYQDRVFGIFKRLHSRDQYEGTGVGLAVTKKIIERNGGRIWVESTPGEGATFHFRLPEVGSDRRRTGDL